MISHLSRNKGRFQLLRAQWRALTHQSKNLYRHRIALRGQRLAMRNWLIGPGNTHSALHPTLKFFNLRMGEPQAQFTAAPDQVFGGLRKFLVYQPSNLACR